MANLFTLDCDRHEAARSHLRLIRRDGVVTDDELDDLDGLLTQNLTEAEDDTEQNYAARAALSNGTDTEHVRSLFLRRWAKKGLIVIEGGKVDQPEAA